MPRKTAIADALEAAGYQPPRERLDAIIADTVVRGRAFPSREAMVQDVIRQIIGDAALLWALFQPFANKAIGTLLEAEAARVAAQRRASSKSGANTTPNTKVSAPQRSGGSVRPVSGPTPAQHAQARREVVEGRVAGARRRVLSKLDTFLVNGRPIGDCTPEEALAWRASRIRDARYVWLLCAGVPHDQPIRNHQDDAAADALYERAQRDAANE